MALANAFLTNFAGGEMSPKMRGRFDLPIYKNGCEKIINFIVETQGPLRYRAGTIHAHLTRYNNEAVLIPFQFNDVQSYLMEFTNLRIRFYTQNGVLLGAAKAISGITKANPCVFTVTGHGLSTGMEVSVESVAGMTQVNNKFFYVNVIDANTFSILDVDGVAIDSSSFSTYTSGGNIYPVVEIASPYAEADLSTIRYAQNADVMYLTHKNYPPMKLTRTGIYTFTINTYTRTSGSDPDPFGTAGDYPGAVAFFEGRLVMGGTTNDPETFYLSRAADTAGNPRYDDFTLGTDDDHACCYTFAPEASGKVDAIRFFAPTNKFLVAGTFGGMKKITGATESISITPKSINVKAVDSFGVENIAPVIAGGITMYVQRGGLIMRTFEYDWESESYVSIDRTLLADHITGVGIKQIAFQYGDPDVLWCVRTDGQLVGLTYKSREDISGWHRHILGGKFQGSNARAISVGVMPQLAEHDQVWVVVERTVGGKTRRSVEYMAPVYYYPEQDQYYTGDEEADRERYQNAMYQAQKHYIHMDSALTFNGADRTAGVTLTPGAVTGDSVIFTASASVFTAEDVDNQIWKNYIDGVGGGRAVITEYISGTQVRGRVTKDFNNTDVIAGSNWIITVGALSGLYHLEGETVKVVTDGAVHPDCTVSGGAISLEYQAGVVHVGFGYTGFVKTLNLSVETSGGNNQAKKRCIKQAAIKFLFSLGAMFGATLYRMESLLFRGALDYMNRPPALFSGNKIINYQDEFGANDAYSKHVVVMQKQPLPCVVQAVDLTVDVTEE